MNIQCKFCLIVSSLILTISSQVVLASGVCREDKSDLVEDTQKIRQKLIIQYGCDPTQNCGSELHKSNEHIREIFDAQELKLDRSLPFLNKTNSVGIVSHGKVEQWESYGSAVLISKCHVLTNAHVISENQNTNFNEPIFVSLGQNSCNSTNEFLHQNMVGKVIAIGSPKFSAIDFAIIKINEITDIQPATLTKSIASLDDALMMVGFPYKSTYSQLTGLRIPTVNFIHIIDSRPDGSFLTSNATKKKGGSGSPLFALDEDKQGNPRVVLIAIHQGEGGSGVQGAAILNYIKVHNPSVYEEIKTAVTKGTCNQ